MAETVAKYLLLAVFLLGWPIEGPANAREPGTPPNYVVIIGGGKTVEEAERVFNNLRKNKIANLTFSEGFPKVISSDSVKGLKPGFVVLIGGFCKHSGKARLAREILLSSLEGVYLRKVPPLQPESCPEVSRSAKAPPKGMFVKDRVKLGPKSTILKWQVFSNMDKDFWNRGGCPVSQLLLRIMASSQVMTEKEFVGDCIKGAENPPGEEGPEDPGASTQWIYDSFTPAGAQNLLVIAKKSYGGDTGWEEYYAYGFVDGQIKKVLSIGGFPAFGPNEYKIEADNKSEKFRADLLISSGGEAERYQWDTKKRQYVLVK